ncbi:DNA primase, partial [Streptococcus pyogenes]
MKQEKLIVKSSPLQELHIATGNSRTAKTWKNITLTWQELVERLEKPTVTQETFAEYQKMSRAEKGQAKDVGGFVGGWLKQGKRK